MEITTATAPFALPRTYSRPQIIEHVKHQVKAMALQISMKKDGTTLEPLLKNIVGAWTIFG